VSKAHKNYIFPLWSVKVINKLGVLQNTCIQIIFKQNIYYCQMLTCGMNGGEEERV
jgi:hypothetical protein